MDRRRLWTAGGVGALAAVAAGQLWLMAVGSPLVLGITPAAPWLGWLVAAAAGAGCARLARSLAKRPSQSEQPPWTPGVGGCHPKALARPEKPSRELAATRSRASGWPHGGEVDTEEDAESW